MTGCSIPDMLRIVQEHGCVPIPLDLDMDTFAPPMDQVKAALSDKTVAVIFAQVLGITYDLAPYAELLKPRGIDLIEDLAQSFKSAYITNGQPDATLTMFSFGLIKHNTAFYGGVSVVRDKASVANRQICPNLYKSMHDLQENYPTYSREEYSKKISSAFKVWMVLNSELAIKAALKICRMKGLKFEEVIISKLRGFPDQADFLSKFRIKPNAPLIAMIWERTSTQTAAEFKKRNENYWKVTDALSKEGIFYPAQFDKERTFWLYWLPVANPI